jgi:hypothetical protein
MPSISLANMQNLRAVTDLNLKMAGGRMSGSSSQSHTAEVYGRHMNIQGNEHRYYQAIRDSNYIAIRPIATKFATQVASATRVAMVPRRRVMSGPKGTKSWLPPKDATKRMMDSLRSIGYIDKKASDAFNGRQKELYRRMPSTIKSVVPSDSIVLEEHEILEALKRPNELHDIWSTFYMVASSLLSCGKGLLLWDTVRTTAGEGGQETAGVFYIPMTWATPDHTTGPVGGWHISPLTGESGFDVKRGQFVYFHLPNCADPLGGFSPMMGSASSSNISDEIIKTQQSLLRNLIHPSYAIVAGQSTNPGGGMIKFTKSQRDKIVDTLKKRVGGALRAGDPVVLDALIEDIRDISPKHNDIGFSNGMKMHEDRVMQSYGTSPVIAGFVHTNRAGTEAAHEIFYDQVVNPMLTLSGTALTHAIAGRHATDDYQVVVYHEPASTNDPDRKLKRIAVGRDVVGDKEMRTFIRTGETDWDDEDVPPKPADPNRRQGTPFSGSGD